ncbi:MAG: hypothetical protein ACE5GY_03965 [Thermodesulfobacteriota bacterium]
MEQKEEFLRVIDALARRLEFLEYAGIDVVRPAEQAGPQAPADGVYAEAGEQADAAASGFAEFRFWPLGDYVLFVEGVATDGSGMAHPFPPAHIQQLDKIARWMAEELGVNGFSAGDGWRDEVESPARGCPREVEARVLSAAPRVIVAFGPLAAAALASGPDVEGGEGRFHDFNGIPVMPTHSPGAIIGKQRPREETHRDMKKVLERLK